MKPAKLRWRSKEGSSSRRALGAGLPQPRPPIKATGRASCLQKCGDLLPVPARL